MQEASAKRRIFLYKLWAAQKGLCGICGTSIEEDEVIYPALVNVDHIIPRSLNGGNTQSNQQLTHTPCNTVKGARVNFSLDERAPVPAPRTAPPRGRSKAAPVRFVADGLDQGARVVYEPRGADDGEPWVAETRFGGHVAINGKRFRSEDVITAADFDRKWRKRK